MFSTSRALIFGRFCLTQCLSPPCVQMSPATICSAFHTATISNLPVLNPSNPVRQLYPATRQHLLTCSSPSLPIHLLFKQSFCFCTASLCLGPTKTSQNNLAHMDPADNITQFMVICDNSCFTLNINMDTMKMLEVIAIFKMKLVFKPWLRETLGGAELNSGVAMFKNLQCLPESHQLQCLTASSQLQGLLDTS